MWVCGWGGGCSDDCGLDLRLTTWEERLVCFHNMFLMTQVHAALMTYIFLRADDKEGQITNVDLHLIEINKSALIHEFIGYIFSVVTST